MRFCPGNQWLISRKAEPTPRPRTHFALESSDAQVLIVPLLVVAVIAPDWVTISTCMVAPSAIMKTFLIAPASTNARMVFSFTTVILKEGMLLGYRYANFLTMFTNQYFNHVGNTAVIPIGSFTYGFFNAGVDAQI
jgi:hypothetical protein